MPMRITHSKNAASAKSYFELSDYLEADPNQLLKGRWFGKAAESLGLVGEVDKADFDSLVDNKHPRTGEQMTPRQRADRRNGTDLTFSAPKSVSVLWAYTQDDRILEAMQQASFDTLAELEKVAQTRVNHSRGVMSLAKTRNIAGASWLHTTSRPMNGYPDPNLHTHNFVLNMTDAGGRWTALDLSSVVRDSGLYEKTFQSNLARNLQAIGYQVERNDRDFEIKSVSRSTINKFSRRTALIEAEAKERGITDAAKKGALGAQTRDRKAAATVPASELPGKWRSLLTEQEKAALDAAATGEKFPGKEEEREAARMAIDAAIKHQFERDSVVRERQLLGTAIQRGIGTASAAEIVRQLEESPLIREGE
ncbi:MAG: MobF family relaxase, partial [Planctomycetota bacterium]